MKVFTDVAILINVLEPLHRIDTEEGLISWVSQDLQLVFPHRAFLCGIGRIHGNGIAPVKIMASNFPLDYLQSLKQPGDLYCSAAIKSWLASGDVLLFDPEAMTGPGLDRTWRERFKASGLQNIAAHGIHDLSRQHASYFSFHQIPEPLGERHRFLLQILIPHMHATVLRILHKIKADATVVKKDRALTKRELEVLAWVCAGKTSAEVATILGIANSTVRNQIQSVLVKLRVNTRSQAAAKAIMEGLVIAR